MMTTALVDALGAVGRPGGCWHKLLLQAVVNLPSLLY